MATFPGKITSGAQPLMCFHHPAVAGLPGRVDGAKATDSFINFLVSEAAGCFFSF